MADFVVSVKDGRISAQGSASDVLGKTESLKDEAMKDEQSLEKGAQEIDSPADKKPSRKLIIAEEMDDGHVGWSARTCTSARGFLVSYFGQFNSISMRWAEIMSGSTFYPSLVALHS